MSKNLEYFESFREIATEIKNKIEEKFPERKIKEVRIGRNSDALDIIFLIIDIRDRKLQEYQRDLELKFRNKFTGMIFAVSSSDNLCYDTINADYPLIIFKD